MHPSRIARLTRPGTTLIRRWMSCLALSLLLAGAFACVHAAELGEAQVRSYIGQPLVADVELTTLAEPGAAVQVRLADADVWRGANVRMHPVLSNLALSVMRRDGRQFLHITSVKPVESDYVHLFLTLADGGKREVRALTLWLSADPQPAPPPPVPAPLPVPVPVPVPAAAPAPVRAEPAKVAAPATASAPRPVRVLQLPSAAPLSCPQISEDQVKTCADLDRKNGVLSARIVELEEKVKLLQAAIEDKSAAGHAAAPASQEAAPPGHEAASTAHEAASADHEAASADHEVAPAGHGAASAPHAAEPAVPPPILSRAALAKKNGAAKKDDAFPWVLVGAAVGTAFAAALAAWFLLRRRKRKAALSAEAGVAAELPAAAKPGMFAGLAARFKRKPASPEPAVQVEPEAS